MLFRHRSFTAAPGGGAGRPRLPSHHGSKPGRGRPGPPRAQRAPVARGLKLAPVLDIIIAIIRMASRDNNFVNIDPFNLSAFLASPKLDMVRHAGLTCFSPS